MGLAGIGAGDLILSMHGREVKDVVELAGHAHTFTAGDTVGVELLRAGKKLWPYVVMALCSYGPMEPAIPLGSSFFVPVYSYAPM